MHYNHPGGDIYWSLTNPSTVYGALVSVMFLQQYGQNDTASMVQLQDGFPQAAILSGATTVDQNGQQLTYPANLVVYFNFLLSTNQQYLDVDLYALLGDADVYMNYMPTTGPGSGVQYPRPGSFGWASNLTGSDTIRVNNPQAGRYILGVFHTALNPAQTVPLFLTVSSPLFPQTIQNGLGVRGYVGNNQYKYYQLQIIGTLTDTIELRLAPIRGNPDLYASRATPFTTANAIWRSASPTGVDLITIPYGHPNRTTNGSWTLYIAVHSPAGAGVSEFTLITSLSGGSDGGSVGSIFLEQNKAVPGVVTGGQYDFYRYRPTNLSLPIDVSIMRLDGGSPYVAISTNVEQPVHTVGLYNSSWLGSTAGLVFRLPATSFFACLPRNVSLANCIYYFGLTNYPVTGTPASLTYSIQVGQPGDVTSLYDRVVQQSQLLGGEIYRYMYLNNLGAGRTLVFAVTPSVGDVDIYVSTTPDAGPGNSQWSSAGSGDDVISIRNAAALYYYVAVKNKLNSTSVYSVFGRSYNPNAPGSGALSIIADQSYNDIAASGTYTYYQFSIVGTWPTLVITINARLGDPDIFVNHASLDGIYSWPNETYYRWREIMPGSDLLTITNPPTGILYIGVYAHPSAADVLYTISINGQGRTQVMYTSSTYSAELAPNGYQFYQLTLASVLGIEQLVFSLTSRTGDTNMYISDSVPNPSKTAYNWTSEEGEGSVDLIAIRNVTNAATRRQELHVGTYYVGVYSVSTGRAAFSLYASQGLRQTLVDGRPVSQYLYSGGSMFFEALYGQGEAFSVQVVAVLGTEPLWVYVALNENIVIGRPATYLYSSVTNSSNVDLRVPGTTCTTATCRYTILVYQPASGASYYTSFSISTQTASTITDLSPGVPRGGTVLAAGYVYYTFVLSCPSNVSLFVTTGTGNPDLFVNMGPLPPTRQTAIWQSNVIGLYNDYVSFSPASMYFGNGNRTMVGRYYVSVFGAAQTSSYSIILSVDSQCGSGGGGESGGSGGNSSITYQQLKSGSPQYGRVAYQRWLYYSFTVTRAMWPTGITFALSPTDGSDPDLYITKDGSQPTSANWAWRSEERLGDNDILYISPNASMDPHCPHPLHPHRLRLRVPHRHLRLRGLVLHHQRLHHRHRARPPHGPEQRRRRAGQRLAVLLHPRGEQHSAAGDHRVPHRRQPRPLRRVRRSAHAAVADLQDVRRGRHHHRRAQHRRVPHRRLRRRHHHRHVLRHRQPAGHRPPQRPTPGRRPGRRTAPLLLLRLQRGAGWHTPLPSADRRRQLQPPAGRLRQGQPGADHHQRQLQPVHLTW